jgi:adenine-specific DNA-methyltransferase
MQLNAEDGGHRKYIMVQLEEKTDEKSEAHKAGYNTICEIGEERICRAGDKIKAEHPDADIDIGFKVFEIANTNIKWNELELKDEQIDFANLSNNPDQVDFKQGTKDIDVVYEIMLRQKNIPLPSKIEVLDEIGSRTYLYADSYLICLETQVTNGMIDKLASIDPTPFKYIFRDSAFKDDIDLKTNAFRRLKAMVEKHAGATKKAYTVEFI